MTSKIAVFDPPIRIVILILLFFAVIVHSLLPVIVYAQGGIIGAVLFIAMLYVVFIGLRRIVTLVQPQLSTKKVYKADLSQPSMKALVIMHCLTVLLISKTILPGLVRIDSFQHSISMLLWALLYLCIASPSIVSLVLVLRYKNSRRNAHILLSGLSVPALFFATFSLLN